LTQVSAQIRPDDEIIIIDDNDIQGDFTDLENIHANTRIIRGKIVGISSARNLGVEASTKDLIQFIDSDDEITPGFIESQRNFHMKFKNVSATGVWLQAFGSHSRIYPQWDGFSPLGVYQCLPPAGVLMWKKEALVEVGEFLDEFANGFEDFDLVARAISHDHIIVVNEDISYLYRRGHQSLTQSLSNIDQTDLFELVWKNARNLCDSNFLNFIELGLAYGKKLQFDSVNYIFLGKKRKLYLYRIAKKYRNNNLVRSLWSLLPLSLRSRIFVFAMNH
jgi:glycosyltransferase involved in cell wall biosynthesis